MAASHGIADPTDRTDPGTDDLIGGRDALERAASIAVDPGIRRRVEAEIAAMEHPVAVGVSVLRDLLRIEDQSDRFVRLLRGWTGKVSEAVAAGDHEAADAWLRAVLVSPVHPSDFAEEVGAAFTGLCRPELFDSIVTRLAQADEVSRGGARLLAAFGEPMVRYLIDQMAVDEPVVNRRFLVDFLARAGSADVRLLIAHVADPRWFIVRNLAIALGKTGRSQAVAPLEILLGHEDDRVRVEAIRGLALLDRDASVPVIVKTLGDPSRRVRGAAVSLLRASPSPEVVPEVMRVIEERRVNPEVARRLVEAVADRKDPAVQPALRRLAGRRVAIGAVRFARDAARAALARRAS